MHQLSRRAIVGGVACCAARPASGFALDAPRTAPVPIVRGKLGQTNRAGEATFDLDMLGRLTRGVTGTQIPWHPRRTRFEGPLAEDVLKAVDCRRQTLRIKALDGYAVDIFGRSIWQVQSIEIG